MQMVIALILLAVYTALVVVSGRLHRIRLGKGGYIPLMLALQVAAFVLGALSPLLWAAVGLGLLIFAGMDLAVELRRRNEQLERVGAPTGPRGWRTDHAAP